MVEALANRNPAPEIVERSRWYPVFAKNYDWPAYGRAWLAFGTLIEHAEDAWQEMVGHLGDDRYSITFKAVSTSGYGFNWSVGDVCGEIIVSYLTEGFLQHLQLDKPAYARLRMPDVTRDRRKLRAWCEQRSVKRLFELQIETCEWAIAELKKGGFTGMSTSQRVAAIQSEIDRLRASKQAFHLHSFGEFAAPYSKVEANRLRQRYLDEKDHAARKK